MEELSAQIYIVRTIPGKEDKFVDSIAKVIEKKEGHDVLSFFRADTVKGYIFAECYSLTKLVDVLRTVPNNKGVIRTPVSDAELDKYFEKDGEKVVVHERDIVEIISGPFKGDRAKVVRIVPGKDEIVIEPLNMSVPIPITLGTDDIRIVETKEEETEK
ncbi:transcription elongation factor Spt5 [Candidatus Woesearchaeota archaeon]|nr:transcription elongation factor Spt5 [Nanoarchaeota archaeon]MCB9370219.1 transcription elongation factor Spt5 [Candidatus Woesearchaeota archaeon]USN44744.1 MAG: transcription elongation factor Spt5 [Candidatus Woesearchaeota archaeon]